MNTDPFHQDARGCQAYCGWTLWCGVSCGAGGANDGCGSFSCTNKCLNACGGGCSGKKKEKLYIK